jgi:hypothetical protein
MLSNTEQDQLESTLVLNKNKYILLMNFCFFFQVEILTGEFDLLLNVTIFENITLHN